MRQQVGSHLDLEWQLEAFGSTFRSALGEVQKVKGWSKIRKKDKEGEGSMSAKEARHWAVVFRVRGGDETEEQRKRAHEGRRRGRESP